MGEVKSYRRFLVGGVLLFFVAIVFDVPKAILLYSGYCLEEKRYLSDQEIFDIAVQEIVNERDIYMDHAYYKINRDGEKILMRSLIKKYNYSNLKEFHALNPHCCKFVNYVQDDGGKMRIPCAKKTNGQIRKFVAAEYVFGFNEDDGNKPVSVIGTIGVSNCGDKLWTRSDIIKLYQSGW